MGFHPLSVGFYSLFKGTRKRALSIAKAFYSPPSLDLWSLARARRGGVSREAARGWGFRSLFPLPLSLDKPEPRPIGAQAPYTRLHPHACGKRAAPAGNNRSGP